MKQRYIYVLVLCVLFICRKAVAQQTNDYYKEKYVETAFNISSVLTNTPFINSASVGLLSSSIIAWKWHGTGKKRSFKLSLGGRIPIGESDRQVANFLLSLGSERMRPLGKGWNAITGNDFILALDFNTQEALLGYGAIYGVRYDINPRVSIGTESWIFVGFTTGNAGFGFELLPPTSLNISYRFFK